MLHANPLYRYKRWTDAGWRGLARGLAERGLTVVVTEGPDAAERAYLDELWGRRTLRMRPRRSSGHPRRGQLDWAELAALFKGAAVYVGRTRP